MTAQTVARIINPPPDERTAYHEESLAFLLSAIEARISQAEDHLKRRHVAEAEIVMGWARDAIAEARKMELPK